MERPFFYIDNYDVSAKEITLDEDTSRHIAQVLRMQTGESIHLTDGKGNLLTAKIGEAHKKHTSVTIADLKFTIHASRFTTIGISLLKNRSRFEWFLEKATEIGISEIIPLICERTEKEKFRQDRMQQICISAMLQSQQTWLPALSEPQPLEEIIRNAHQQQKFIAHCMDDAKSDLSDLINETLSSQIVLIGPEGDFTKDEVNSAIQQHFIPVSLGKTRLRTETAGIVSATLLTRTA